MTESTALSDGTEEDGLLLSPLSVEKIAEVLRTIDLYVARWPIEVFVRVFETGCHVKEIQSQTRVWLIRVDVLSRDRLADHVRGHF
ncbi:hypothetical protein [Rubripirellula reticaptiva]|uniref:hypothetical protein n=1 Tax=Rubripirellula reticaptiva TaxID=2528013 RepID=UPI0011B79F02|nr:hypothetical protein [Rubripirellula reticaptiva]